VEAAALDAGVAGDFFVDDRVLSLEFLGWFR